MQTAVSFLQSSQNDDGGWGYAPGQTSSVEPTAAAVLALRSQGEADLAYERGLQWMRAAQHGDGGWGLTAGDKQSGWQTAWALLAVANVDRTVVERAADWLLAVETPEPSADAIEQVQPLLEIDLTLHGWPWRPAEATWVEPTALTLLALAAAGRQNASRVVQAVPYLADRRCQIGGWNMGNPVMFSQPLPPRAHPTAWTLLALARVAPGTVLPQDMTALRSAMIEDGGALALAWGLLALHTLDQEDPAARARLVGLQHSDGSWNANPYHTAVAVLALEGERL